MAINIHRVIRSYLIGSGNTGCAYALSPPASVHHSGTEFMHQVMPERGSPIQGYLSSSYAVYGPSPIAEFISLFFYNQITPHTAPAMAGASLLLCTF